MAKNVVLSDIITSIQSNAATAFTNREMWVFFNFYSQSNVN